MGATGSSLSRFRLRLRTILALIAILALLMGGYIAVDRALDRFMFGLIIGKPGGPVQSRKDWPFDLQQLLDKPDGAQVNQASIQVFCLCKGSDLEYVWRVEASPELIELLKQRWSLAQVSKPAWPILKGRSPILGVPTPSWWSPKVNEDTSFFANEGEPGDGPGVQVAVDRRLNLIYVHWWNSF